MLSRGTVRGVDLAVIVAAAAQSGQLVVGEVLDQTAQSRVGPEEVLADVRAAGYRVLLELAVDGLVHLVDEQALDVAGQQVVPLTAPDHLDDVPAGAAEEALEFLDDLAVAAYRPVEALQVAIDDEGEIVQALASGQREGSHGLGLVHLTVANERPDVARGGVGQAAIGQVSIQAGLVDGRERAEAHGHRREFPEPRHRAWVRVARQPHARQRLLAEVVEVLLRQAPLQEGPGVDAGRSVALEEDLVARAAVVLAAEEVVETHLVQRCGAGIGGEVATQSRVGAVRSKDHGHRIPTDEPPDTPLDLLIAREEGLLLRADGIDVAGLGQRRQADMKLASPLEDLVKQEAGALVPLLAVDLVQRVQPLLGFGRIDIGQLVLELVDVHGSADSPGPGPKRRVASETGIASLRRVAHRSRDVARDVARAHPATRIVGYFEDVVRRPRPEA